MTPSQPQAQTANSSSPFSHWDKMDAWWHAREKSRREEWAMQAEQAERDAMFTAEVRGGPSLMERAAGPLLFLATAGVAAVIIVAVGKGMGWFQ